MADFRTRRLVVRIAGLALLAVLGAALDRAVRLASIGVAYKAKMLCSGVFVSARDPQNILADLEVDDLAMLRHVSVSMDRATRSVTATILGIVTRWAVYRDGLGCALAFDTRTPDGMSAGSDALDAVARARSQPVRSPDTAPAIGSVERGRLNKVLDRAFEEPNPLRQRRTRAVVIVHQGHIVAERYAADIGPDTPLIGWSMTKSVMNALAGILVNEGRLSVDRPVPMPEWQTPGDPRSRITLDQLLRMSSGLQFDEDMTDPRADVIRMLLGTDDMSTYAGAKGLEATPGTKWQYSSGTSNIIARTIRNVLADDHNYWAFPRRALFNRLGMTGAVMETDAAGTFVGSSFMYATARDWARFGMLYLQDGVWNGQRILPEGWVQYTRSPAPSDPLRHYGTRFWLAVPEEYRGIDESVPHDAFHAAGHEAQLLTIVPSADTVIVRLGLTRYADAWDHGAFVRDVLAALRRARE
jgi:CubicO group peptidase (beta-lactamase class C family)